MSETVTIVVNGQEVEADPTKPLIHACHAHDVEVPHYCYHPGLSPVGSCRICQVEVKQGEMPPRVVVACRTPVAPGMEVDTEAPKAHDARRECLEFLLKNHPLDCPICDKAGECTLQDYSFTEGQGLGRSVEPRRQLAKRKDLGDVIVLDQERCILCSRCVRFMEEVPKTPQLVVSQRGAHSVIETFADRPLSGNYQGNLADVCPVGALTLKAFRFRARVWNLFKVASTCAECSRGCANTVEVLRRTEVKRFRPRHDDEVNGWWMCDTGRFALESTALEGRFAGAAIPVEAPLPWKAIEVREALDWTAGMLRVHEEREMVLSPFMTQEEVQSALELARALDIEPLFVSPPSNDLKDDVLHTGDPCPNRRGLEQLGVAGLDAESIRTRLGACQAALLIGDRIGDLIGRAEMQQLPPELRLVVFDSKPLNAPAVDLVIAVPCHVERQGTWINVDGMSRTVGAARPAPRGTWLATRSLDALTDLVRADHASERDEVAAR